MTDDPMVAIRAIFFEECAEQLSELETGLLAMQSGALDPETLNAVFRAVHSVKGGAGAFALDDLVRFAHVFETTLDDVRSGRKVASHDLIRLMLQAADILADLVTAARDGSTPDAPRAAQIAQALADFGHSDISQSSALVSAAGTAPQEPDEFGFTPVLASASVPIPTTQPNDFTVIFRARRELYAKGNEPAVLMRELSRLGKIEVTLDSSALPELTEIDPEDAYLTWTVHLSGEDCHEGKIREVFDFVDDDCELSITPNPNQTVSVSSEIDIAAIVKAALSSTNDSVEAKTHTDVAPELVTTKTAARAELPTPAATAPTIRVDLERVDRLINLVGELVINSAMLSQRITEAGFSRRAGVALGLDELEQLTREIQDSVMAIRAQPVECHQELTHFRAEFPLRIDPCFDLALAVFSGGHGSDRHGIIKCDPSLGATGPAFDP